MRARKQIEESDSPLVADPAPSMVRNRARLASGRVQVEGFGCPCSDWPHHVRVLIPKIRGGPVTIVENFGIGGHAKGAREELEHCVLPRARWSAIAEAARREFNDRLRARGLPMGAWRAGETKVERMLGQELILLACACAAAEEAELPAIQASWSALRPEERWWFAGWLSAHGNPQVMRGAALLLSGGPAVTVRPTPPVREWQAGLPLFDEDKQ